MTSLVNLMIKEFNGKKLLEVFYDRQPPVKLCRSFFRRTFGDLRTFRRRGLRQD